jgi:circadian clock protein KaiC
MRRQSKPITPRIPAPTLLKCPSGIRGLDAITGGGFPRGRPTLVCGGSGCGKTLFAMEFLVRGIDEYDEPGVFMCFEEREKELAQNVASLGFDLPRLIASNRLLVDQVTIERADVAETGEYSLDGLFIRLGAAIAEVGARRVVLDTIEALFGALSNQVILRAELRRLFEWLKDQGVTTIVTGERGDRTLTRQGLEEYVSDCVILLDQRVTDQIATRRLRIVKYRGSAHGTNEYPFLIDKSGFTVLPITGISLNYAVPTELVSTGIPKLDAMFTGGGYYRGGTLLVSGSSGTGKTSIASHFIDAACRRGERCIYFAFEESPDQLMRNMRSIGLDLSRWVSAGLLQFVASRPSTEGLETHLNAMLRAVEEFKPSVVAIDPISSFESAGTAWDVRAMLMRVIDLFKARAITTMCTTLTRGGHPDESTPGVSSLMDGWVLLRNVELGGERTRTLFIIKSRGKKHSNQARELVMTDDGIDLVDVFVGPDGDVLVGSARANQAQMDKAAALSIQQNTRRRKAHLLRRRKAVEAQIAQLQADLAADVEDAGLELEDDEANALGRTTTRAALARERESAGRSGGVAQANGGKR